MHRLIPISLALACTGGMTTPPEQTAPDLTASLTEEQVRAGVIDDEAATFGGVSAEGRAGDIKIYNDRVQFVIQGMRDGSYYFADGGGVIDADIIRDGPGNDFVDEWQPALNIGSAEPVRVEVVEDGSNGSAMVRVDAIEAAFGIVEGALEAPDFLPELGVRITTEYRLEPGSWFLEVHTTMTTETDTETAIGDLFAGGPEVASTWSQGIGMGEEDGRDRLWTGFVDHDGDGAAAILSADGSPLQRSNLQLLTELTDMVVGFGPRTPLAVGESMEWTRLWGMAPDMATLTDAALTHWGTATEPHTWTVEDDDGPVPGARVVVLVDDEPYTMATTDEAGVVNVLLPTGSSPTARAVGHATGFAYNVPDAPYGPYGSQVSREQSLAALSATGPSPSTEGRGVSTAEDPLRLTSPAMLTVNVDDDLPYTVLVTSTSGLPAIDPRLAGGRPSGHAAVGFSRGGSITIPVEPGTHRVLVHRGPRYELHQETAELVAGQTVEVEASLTKAYEHPGWLVGDLHSHASPSADGSITMEERILVSAAHGVQIHVGSDHDHAADYRPLVGTLGLEQAIVSIVSNEVSPPARGHFNIYPLESLDAPNGGAWRWWTESPPDTEGVVDAVHAIHGSDIIVQANHPTDDGIATQSLWEPGEVRRGDYWTTRLGAIEVLNAADYEEFLAFWWDLTSRGYITTPVGVSDSHSHLASHIGMSNTFLQVGTDDPASMSNADFAAAVRDGRTIVSLGPWLELSMMPGEVDRGTSLTVTAKSPSWIVVDRLELVRDGVVVETVEGTTATFELSPESDGAYIVQAKGDTPMAPVDNRRPWAMAGPWLVDANGDGWEPSLPPLAFGP